MNIEQLFKQYYDDHFDDILRYLYWSLRSSDLAQDICQASFEALWVLLEKKPVALENAGGWLRKVAQNKSQEHYRTTKRRENKLNEVKESWKKSERSENLSKKLELKEAEAEIGFAISALGYPASEIVYLLDVEKKTYSEVEKLLGISERTIRRIRKNSWQKLASQLEQLAFSERILDIAEGLKGKTGREEEKKSSLDDFTSEFSRASNGEVISSNETKKASLYSGSRGDTINFGIT